MKKKIVNPYWHELSSTGGSCAKSCPACLWAGQFQATGDNSEKSYYKAP